MYIRGNMTGDTVFMPLRSPDEPVLSPPPSPPPPPAGDPWFKGADAETVGYLQNRGLDKKTPAEAALETVKAHREAERLLGVPRDQLVRKPDPKDEGSVKGFWEQFGAPKDAKEYDFSTVKDAKGEPIKAALADAIRNAAGSAHLPKDAATTIAAAVQKQLDADATATTAEKTAKLGEEKSALRTSWGNNHDANMVVARLGAEKLGVDPATVAALENEIGYSKVMEMFRKVGKLSGEATFLDNKPGGTPGVMTKEEAASRITELKQDKAWVAKYMAKDAEAVRLMTSLNTIAYLD